MNILKKWVFFPIAVFVLVIAFFVLLGLSSVYIGWWAFTGFIAVAVGAVALKKAGGREYLRKKPFFGLIIPEYTEDSPIEKNIKLVLKVSPILIIFIWSMSSSFKNINSMPDAPPVPVAVKTTAPEVNKAVVQTELDEYMRLAGTVGLVTSYDLSDTGRVVYVGKIWYSQTVESKKRFLNAISSRMTLLTGYHYFVVRDGYSDEKVAEVTAILGSLEIYK